MWVFISLLWLGLGIFLIYKGFGDAPKYQAAEEKAISEDRFADAKGAQDYRANSTAVGCLGIIFSTVAVGALVIILASYSPPPSLSNTVDAPLDPTPKYNRTSEFQLFDAAVRVRQDQISYLVNEANAFLDGTSQRDPVLLKQWVASLQKEWAEGSRDADYRQEDTMALSKLVRAALSNLESAYTNIDMAKRGPAEREGYRTKAREAVQSAAESLGDMVERRNAIDPPPSPSFSLDLP
jgi:hypothetical protein